MKELEEDMEPEDTDACSVLINLRFARLSPNEELVLDEMISQEIAGVGKARKKVSLKIKLKPPAHVQQLMQPADIYIAPLIPPVRGLAACFIKDCSVPFDKQLTVTDLKDGQSRLFLSKYDAEKCLLPLVKGMDLKSGVPATVYDMEGKLYSMIFKKWSDKYYVLGSRGWIDFYKFHNLKPVVDFVTVWMFRHGVTNRICFALSSRRRLDVNHHIRKYRKG